MAWDGFEWVDTGPVDLEALGTVRDVALHHEPLVQRGEFDDPITPSELHLHTTAGFERDSGRLDVSWTTKGYYRFHYSEGGSFDFRYDRHPHPDAPDAHFHPPPDCPDHEALESCIRVESPPLVALAVLQLWGDAVRENDLTLLSQSSPP